MVSVGAQRRGGAQGVLSPCEAAPAVAEALELAKRARAPAGAVTERQRDVEDIEQRRHRRSAAQPQSPGGAGGWFLSERSDGEGFGESTPQ